MRPKLLTLSEFFFTFKYDRSSFYACVHSHPVKFKSNLNINYHDYYVKGSLQQGFYGQIEK